MAQNIDLSGNWELEISQQIDAKQVTYALSCTLSQLGDQVIGQMVFDLDKIQHQFTSILNKGRKFDIQLKGRVIGAQLQMQYLNLQREIPQFGSLLSTLESSDRMNGLFIGFGPESGGLISGTVHFKRM